MGTVLFFHNSLHDRKELKVAGGKEGLELRYQWWEVRLMTWKIVAVNGHRITVVIPH